MPTLDDFLGQGREIDPHVADSDGAGSGRDFLNALLRRPREAEILAAVKDGSARIRWGTIESAWKDHTATLFVMRDALAVGTDDDFVRVPVRCDTAQAIADHLGALLPTPHVADMIYDAADVKLAPMPQNTWVKDNTMGQTSRVLEYHALVQRGLDAAGAQAGHLLANMGKHWVITNRLWEPGRKGFAANYGWHRGPTSADALWQPVEVGHGFAIWVDYSQLLQLVGPVMIVDGETMSTVDVMQSPDLYGLVSSEKVRCPNGVTKAEGPLRGVRHPSAPAL
jgi:hypothetical protein